MLHSSRETLFRFIENTGHHNFINLRHIVFHHDIHRFVIFFHSHFLLLITDKREDQNQRIPSRQIEIKLSFLIGCKTDRCTFYLNRYTGECHPVYILHSSPHGNLLQRIRYSHGSYIMNHHEIIIHLKLHIVSFKNHLQSLFNRGIQKIHVHPF